MDHSLYKNTRYGTCYITHVNVSDACKAIPLTAGRNVRRMCFSMKKWESRFTLQLNAAKNTHHIQKSLKKNCLELNFLQKSPRTHMFIISWCGATRLERLIWLKYYILLKEQITFTLGLNAAKNTHHIQKYSK